MSQSGEGVAREEASRGRSRVARGGAKRSAVCASSRAAGSQRGTRLSSVRAASGLAAARSGHRRARGQRAHGGARPPVIERSGGSCAAR